MATEQLKTYKVLNFSFMYVGKVQALTCEAALAQAKMQFRRDAGLMVEEFHVARKQSTATPRFWA